MLIINLGIWPNDETLAGNVQLNAKLSLINHKLSINLIVNAFTLALKLATTAEHNWLIKCLV